MSILTTSSILVLLSSCTALQTWPQQSNYSLWMAYSIMSRGQGIMANRNDTSVLLQAGLTQKAFRRAIEQYQSQQTTTEFKDYIKESVNSVVPFLGNSTYDITYPLHRLSNGNNLIQEYQESHDLNYSNTFIALRKSIDLQPRNPACGLWYFVYPEWSYLDGMFSLLPFYTEYTQLYVTGEASRASFHDIQLQLDLLWQHCYDNRTDLLVHGYDYSKSAIWANPITGGSPHVWGRSLGWYMMALVDTLELAPNWSHLQTKFQSLSEAVVKARDAESGAWWQILDQPSRAGNYIESSGSAMFVYALLKGHRLGYLHDYGQVASQAYEYIVNHFVVDNGNGTLGYNGTVAVCSLNSTASYEYYISQPLLYNSMLGSASFVLASLEIERHNMM